ncbi:MAG: glycoside hydrolase family 5 protein [Kiritimatiellaeota bacterium]|nr:glycoside hydrolase family 5 protein [Kiritimatiellota bacterium]
MKVIDGFVRAEGRTLRNDAGEIVLRGWGIGNWLLCEGYMWMEQKSTRMDRPNRIERFIQELLGATKAKAFWQAFRENYVTLEDVKYMKAMGHNSIRLPINWALFLEDEPGVVFKEEGFKIIDKAVAWCKEADLYLLIDMHGAPGGQTGANIDDSVDDMPRLFMDADKFEKGVALWAEIARRYKDEAAVAGYDLLNEPIREGMPDVSQYVPDLVRFYDAAIGRIRGVDTRHLIALEGHYWATNLAFLTHKYDDNYCLHFHRYREHPEMKNFAAFLDASKKWDIPLWLGETGENYPEWFSAIAQICEEHHISYHFWPYKKMGKVNCSMTIATPDGWDDILAYAAGGKHPGYDRAEKILAEYLDNLLLAKCSKNPNVDRAILRNGEYTLRATDYAERPGCFHGHPKRENLFDFRQGKDIEIVEVTPKGEPRFFFDHQWDRFNIVLSEGEFVSYHAPRFTPKAVTLHGQFTPGSRLRFAGKEIAPDGDTATLPLDAPTPDLLKLECLHGTLRLDRLLLH